jgi:hypothetical protein
MGAFDAVVFAFNIHGMYHYMFPSNGIIIAQFDAVWYVFQSGSYKYYLTLHRSLRVSRKFL